MSKEKYSSDSPVCKATEDRFSRWSFAERVADVISSRKDPDSIIIGLYGVWGDGKTSVLNFIEESINEKGTVITVKFNPWLFGDVESLLRGFFDILAETLDAKLITNGEKLKDILKKAAPGIASVAGVQGLGEAVGVFLHGPDIIELRKRIEEELKKSRKRILVIIDDVDRLEKSEIQALFKIVKLVADFKYTVHIVAFDKDVVADSLSESYSGTNKRSGEQFLEKIIQIPLHLPAIPAKDLHQFCFQGVHETLTASGIALSEQQFQEFMRYFTLAFDENLTTPRKAKLYSNILMFSLPMLKDEVNPVDLMLIEGIRIFAPKLYEAIRNNKESFVITLYNSYPDNVEPEKQRIKGIVDDALILSGIKDSSGYIELLENMFPKLQTVYRNRHYKSDWYQSWNDGQRICAEEYFDRYFIYSVPKDDFSDFTLNQIVKDIAEIGDNISLENNPLRNVLTPDNAGALIRKLRKRAASLDHIQSIHLSTAVCLSATEYPNPEAMLAWDIPHVQAAMLISDLILNLDRDKRVAIVKELIKKANSPSFQFEIYRWLRREESDKPEKNAFTSEEIDEIREVLADCLESHIRSIYDTTVEDSRILPHLFYILTRHSRRQVIYDHIKKVLDIDKSVIVRLLDAYTHTDTAWRIENNLSHKSDFERIQYNSVTKVFNPEFILDSIKQYLGELPDVQGDFPGDSEHNDRKIVLSQFVWVHRRVLEEGDEEKAQQ